MTISIGIVAGFALFLTVVWLIVSPLLTPRAPEFRAGAESRSSTDVNKQEATLHAGHLSHEDQRAELELDYRTGKMSSEDYERLSRQ